MKKQALLLVLLLVGCSIFMSGCIKPKKVQKWEDIEPHQTAFVIEVEGDMSKQVQIGSAKEWEKYIVQSVRIPYNQRWHSTGHGWWTGRYIKTTKIIKIDRSDVVREWCVDISRGTNQKDEAIWAESSDSIEFSVPVTIVANIKKEDTARFLYYFKGDSLSEVINTVARSHVQTVFTDVSAKYPMTILRSKKREIKNAIKTHLEEFFPSRGITITNIGLSGGFTYKDAEIQLAINKVFKADQKIAEEDKLQLAQEKTNLRIKKEAEALRIAAITKSKGEAEGIRLVTAAAAEANKNPAFMELKKLEVETKRIAQWNGEYPYHYWSTGNGKSNLGIIVNSPTGSFARK